MTLPGAETMKAGIRGVDCLFLSLSWVRSISSRMPLTVARPLVPLVRKAMSTEGEDGELLSEGVCICREVVLELDLEWVSVWRGFALNDRLVELPVIARRACSQEGAAKLKYSVGEWERSGNPRQSDTRSVWQAGGRLAETVLPM